MLRSVPGFSVFFAIVCGLEFSVNQRIGKNYGSSLGITCSALSGAFFLVAADHLMLHRKMTGSTLSASLYYINQIGLKTLWTGFTPMVCRESLFILSVMHLGPKVGELINKNSSLD